MWWIYSAFALIAISGTVTAVMFLIQGLDTEAMVTVCIMVVTDFVVFQLGLRQARKAFLRDQNLAASHDFVGGHPHEQFE
jgi:hypothetical protein